MEWVHPVFGTVAILLTLWLMSRGLVARQGTKASTGARRMHKRWGWWVLGAMALALSSGIVSTVLVRPDLELGETWHLAVGFVSVGLMGLGALLTRRFTASPQLRSWHLVVGLAAVLAALFQGVLGIELLP